MMSVLRQQYDIGRLLCEGGPSFYGELLQQQLIDEDFRTISAQVLGTSSRDTLESRLRRMATFPIYPIRHHGSKS